MRGDLPPIPRLSISKPITRQGVLAVFFLLVIIGLLVALPRIFHYVKTSHAIDIAPTISNLQMDNGPTTGGNTVTIKGENFYGGKEFIKVDGDGPNGIGNAICGLTADGRLYCWGTNTYRVISDATTADFTVPTLVESGDLDNEKIIDFSLGGGHICVILEDNSLWCWGFNKFGQAGQPASTYTVTTPQKILALENDVIIKIATTAHSTCATTDDGRLYCWGGNNYGQLGINNANTDATSPYYTEVPQLVSSYGQIAADGTQIADIEGGVYSMYARATNGYMYSWGRNAFGQLGLGNQTDTNVPARITGISRVERMGGASQAMCAINALHKLYCWGANHYGQVGAGTPGTHVLTPTQVTTTIGSKNILQVEGGDNHVCARSSDNMLYCWGYNASGQLGYTTATSGGTITPTQVTNASVTGLTLLDIATSRSSTCALGTNGAMYCWGFDANGTLGNGATDSTGAYWAVVVEAVDRTNLANTPTVQFDGVAATSVKVIDTNRISAVVPAHAAGAVNVQVTNANGQSATKAGGYTYNATPTVTSVNPTQGPTAGGTSLTVNGTGFTNAAYFTDISTKGTHTCGLSSAKQLYCWGENSFGQLGTGDKVDRDAPVNITSQGALLGKTIAQVATGLSTTCVITTDSRVICWGRNQSGKISDTGVDVTLPTDITDRGALVGNGAPVEVDLGDEQICVRTATGKLICWGDNQYGQIGVGSSGNDITTPTLVSVGGKTITAVKTGGYTTCALASDGTFYCWGRNDYGQVGNGTTTSPVTTPQNISAVGALSGQTKTTNFDIGLLNTCMLTSAQKLICWGYGARGQLGGILLPSTSTPTDVSNFGDLDGQAPASVSVGRYTICTLTTTGNVICAGQGQFGLTGDRTYIDQTSFRNISYPVGTRGDIKSKVTTKLEVGPYHACAITADEQTSCWGNNADGRLGRNYTGYTSADPEYVYMNGIAGPAISIDGRYAPITNYVSPTQVTVSTPPHPYAAVSVNARTSDGLMSANNSLYTYGDFTTLDSLSPSAVLPAGGTVTITGTGFLPGATTEVTIAGVGTVVATYISPTQISFVAPAGTPGTTHDVTVTQNNTPSTNSLPLTYATQPSAPTNLATSPEASSITLSWSAPTSDGGMSITDYVVQYSPDGGTTWNTFNDGTSTATSATVTGLTAGVVYSFRVAAVNDAGQSNWSPVVNDQTLYVTLSTLDAVNFSVTPAGGGMRISSQKDSVQIATNSASGMTVTLEAADTTAQNNLVSGSNVISPVGGTTSAPVTMSANKWGFRRDGLGGFGTGPTTQETNVSSSGFTWASVPVYGSATTIAASTSPTTATYDVWYAMSADMTLPSGLYTNTVIYTAIAQ